MWLIANKVCKIAYRQLLFQCVRYLYNQHLSKFKYHTGYDIGRYIKLNNFHINHIKLRVLVTVTCPEQFECELKAVTLVDTMQQ